MWKNKLKRILKSKLTDDTRTNDVSMRSLASSLNISSGALSEILSGKRRLTSKTANRIIELLELPSEEKEALLSFMEFSRTKKRSILSEETHELLTHWIYFAVLSLLDLDEGPATPAGLSDRLGVSANAVEEALSKLHSHGLVFKTQRGTYQSVHKTLSSTDEVPSETIVQAHERNLRLSAEAVRKVPHSQRDFASLTFSGDSKKLDVAKKQIREFMDRLAAEMCDGDLDQVYQFNLQLFPVLGWEKPE